MNSVVNSDNKISKKKKPVSKVSALFKRRADTEPWLFILPALILIGIFIIFPVVLNIRNSLITDQQILHLDNLEFVGLKNWRSAVNENLLQMAIRNTVIFTVISVVLSIAVAFGIALLLDRVRRGATAYRLFLVIPWVLPPVVTAWAWKWTLNEKFGFLNYYLLKLGIIEDNVAWLGGKNTAFAALIIANVWRFFPFVMIMLLAALKSTSKELEEAAEIDGAGLWQKIIWIIIPQIRNVIIIVVLLTTIWTSNDFTLVMSLTNGGPLNATMVLPVLIKNVTFLSLRYGTASALSVTLVFILLILSIIYLRIVRRSSDQ